jgi:Holliday junction resolvase RusA-like endonuclease
MVTLHTPYPPSANEMFFNRSGNGRGRGKATCYRDWQKEADALFLQQKAAQTIGTPIDGHFHVTIALDQSRRRHNSDLDNRIKPLLDFLQRVELIQDDKFCDKLDIAWAPVDGAFIRAFKSLIP